MRLWRPIPLALFLGVVGLLVGSPTTTTASGTAFTYGAPTIARVDVHQIVAAEAGPNQLGVESEELGSPPTAAGGASTTSFRSFIATNTADDALRALSTSEQRAVRSLQQQVADHTAKLEAYQVNPSAFDNLGILERAPTAEIRQSIIDGRVRHLNNEIQAFQDQIDKLLGGAG